MRTAIFILCASAAFAQTSTLTSLTAASPNSVSANYSSTAQLSLRIACGTDNATFAIVTPWIPISNIGTVTGTITAAQLQAATGYHCRMEGATAAGGGGTVTPSTSMATTTNASVQSYPTAIGLGATTSYNFVQFPNNGRWSDGDTAYNAQLQNGTIVMQQNDGDGNEKNLTLAPYSGGRNTWFSTVDAAFTQISLLNPLGTGDGSNGFGGRATASVPACYAGDNSTAKSKSIFAQGNSLFWIPYRQTFIQYDSYINRSDDGGATWYNPSHTPQQASANGDPACVGQGVMWSTTGIPLFVGYGQGGIVTNPVNGIDAYWYITFINNTGTPTYSTFLFRCHKSLNPQVVGNWEYYTGAIGGDENLQSNWSGSIGSASNIFTQSASQQDCAVQYLPQFARFVMTCENFVGANDYRMIIFDSAQVTGPYVNRFSEGRTQPFNSTYGQFLNRAWINFFMPTYTAISSVPPTATAQLIQSGTFDEAHDGDPKNDLYSPWITNITMTTTIPAQIGGSVTVAGNAQIH